ncbi:hypothetical protein WG66_010092 [Moniliophthora roreri]|nr:hypothetical protein WG66_010092 [Moniliophthora roreri]
MDLFKSLTGRVIAVLCKAVLSNVLPASEASAPLTTSNSQPEQATPPTAYPAPTPQNSNNLPLQHSALTMFQGNSGFTIIGGQFNNVYGDLLFTTEPVTPALTIRDAAGREFPIPAGGQVDLKSVGKYLEWFFYSRREPISDVLLKFVEESQYSLAIDEGRQVIRLGSGEEQWARVMPGTKIVMSVILWQKKKRFSSGYECPICKTWNSGQEPGLNIAGDCCNPKCDGRFQAFEEDQDYDQASSNEKQNKDRNIKILQNLHIMQALTIFSTTTRQLSVYINGRYITVYWSGLDYECQDDSPPEDFISQGHQLYQL